MTGGSHIVAIDAGAPEGAQAEPQIDNQDDDVLVIDQVWEEDASPLPGRSRLAIALAAFAGVVVAGWTGLFFWVNQTSLLAGGSPAEWLGWIRDWSMPVLLVGVAWLIAMRSSRREAYRFGQAARLLGDESTNLERRLNVVNSELSLAREFLSSQTRDLEAMGRLATDRLAQHAERMSSLLHDNGARLDTIGTVSAAALENMERLRGQLPVIASSAKDVTNNIATAGRTAESQLEKLIQGFNRLNQFGQASEQQVAALRAVVDATISEFTKRTEHLDVIATERFAALTGRSEEFRTQLDADEVEALAAIRTRAKALVDELVEARTALDNQEEASLASLRSRLGSVREESGTIARSLRDGEGAALDAWRKATAQLEEDLRKAIVKVAEIDDKAMDSARARIAALADEADELDARMAERDRLFLEEVSKRSAEFDQRHEEFSGRLSTRLADLDEGIAQRQQTQEDHAKRLVEQSQTVAVQLEAFAARMDAITEHGNVTEAALAGSLSTLAEKLIASRDALDGTSGAVTELTDSSVRLLELIRASVDHSSKDLPEAIRIGETRLLDLETRAIALRGTVAEAKNHGADLSDYIIKSRDTLLVSMEEVQVFHGDFASNSAKHIASLNELRQSLDNVRAESTAVASLAQDQLEQSIEQLNTSARAAVAGIEDMSAKAVADLAARLGEESSAAIDQVMRSRA
ncbi:ATPase, partial [Novosphingobium sp.]|uniref:ATPase n=1 Tax=Novosphingobium sp. TaxID=1874826 RepID=UPI0025CD2744